MEAPKSRVNYYTHSFNHPKSIHNTLIETHWFNYKVEILLPHTTFHSSDPLLVSSPAPSHLLLPEVKSHSFYFLNGPLVSLIDDKFIKDCVEHGYRGLVIGNRLGVANCACLLPNGNLVLSTDKDTHQELGLEAAKSAHYKEKQNEQWRVTLNLPLCSPPFRERIRQCITNRMTDMKFLLISSDGTPPTSLSTPFTTHSLKSKNTKITKYHLPLFDFQQILSENLNPTNTDQSTTSNITTFFQLIGFMHNQLPLPISPSILKQKGDLYIRSWKGLISSSFIFQCMDLLRKRVNNADNNLPWAVLTVWGFEDTPVAWGEDEHAIEYSGENDYTFIIFPGDLYICYVTYASLDHSEIKKKM